MSSPRTDDVEFDEVEFVSEAPVNPILECIDLLSDSDEDGCSSSAYTLEDKIGQHKAQVTSTLDRLAQKVAQEKRERADKCREFKKRQISQKAHGQQELALNSTNGVNLEAKRCVDMWLKMPGVTPGVISGGSGRRRLPAILPRCGSKSHTCPVINCGRVYDNISLLDGHLKRFDHSPCDPAIHLRGSPAELFACVCCGQNFHSTEEWRKHVESKVLSSSSDSHSMDQTYQRIVCFACPACFLLFNLRDECLQHMSAKNHFRESLAMSDSRGAAQPVPVPQTVKNRLIALCKEIPFSVRCSLCHQVLTSHQAAQAHFKSGCALAKADRTIVEVIKQLQVRGQCSVCSKLFFKLSDIDMHKESMQHEVELNRSMAKALLQYGKFIEIQHDRGEVEPNLNRLSCGFEISSVKRNEKESDGLPAKRQKLSWSSSSTRSAWFCECGLQFSEEATAMKHLLAVNQIFHQCGVCGKHMGESSIARLHMSRFHGGAHLANFLFFCRKCRVEMPRYEDILSHVSEVHRGHTYITEKDVPDELAVVLDAKPSTSSEVAVHFVSETQTEMAESSSPAGQTWMCRMCEDVFDCEASVRRHCSDVSSHSFQRFVCGHCPQRFFKESTVRRHCMNEHNGQIKSSFFCGLCDSMQFNTEDEFMEHYRSLHSKDYYCMQEADGVCPPTAEETPQLHCPCMGSSGDKAQMKATYTRCMRSLSGEGRCRYVCTPCSVSVGSYAQIKTHIHTKHAALNLDKSFDVECTECKESFVGVPSFHKHYHTRHCPLEPCRKDLNTESTLKLKNAMEVKPDNDGVEEAQLTFLNTEETEVEKDDSDDEMKHGLSLSAEEARESAELEEALQRSLVEF